MAELLMLPIVRASNSYNTFKSKITNFYVLGNPNLAIATVSALKRVAVSKRILNKARENFFLAFFFAAKRLALLLPI